MLWLDIQAPFAACRPLVAGWYRPTAGFLSHSAVYGLVLNLAGIESRLGEHEPGHGGKVPASLTRTGLPAFRQSFRKYVDGDHTHFTLYNIYDVRPELDPATTTLVDHINYGVYQNGEHKFIYDEEKICLVLRGIGFASVSIAPYKEGLDPSNELRQRYSFYVEAIK